MNGFSFNATCRECGTEFAVANTANADFKYAEPFVCNGRKVYLTTLRCPACEALRVVQADDDTTLKVLNESYAIMARIHGIQGRDKSLSGKYKANTKRLAKLRSKLAKQLDGKIAVNDDGVEVRVFVDAKPGM